MDLPFKIKDFTAMFPSADNKEWYKKVGYDDSCEIIRENLKSAANSFITIGYYLKHIRDEKLYEGAGYSSIWECAKQEFGLNETAASRYIGWNTEYSIDGDSPLIDDKYKDFSKSQLQEMFSLSEAVRKDITSENTVQEIREIAKQEHEKQMPTEAEVKAFYERLCEGYVKSGYYSRQTLKDDLKERKGKGHSIMSGGSGVLKSYSCSPRGISINDKEEITWGKLVKLIDRYIPVEKQETVSELESVDVELKGALSETVEETIPGQMRIEQFPEYMPDENSDSAKAAIIDAEYREITKEEEDSKSEVQTKLPLLKNNDQRHEWLKNYKEWGLWYHDENIDVNYYKYDFSDGSRLVVAEYPQRFCYWNEKREDEFFYHLLEKNKQGYKKNYDEVYRNATDSETYLVEFLKRLQKKEKQDETV